MWEFDFVTSPISINISYLVLHQKICSRFSSPKSSLSPNFFWFCGQDDGSGGINPVCGFTACFIYREPYSQYGVIFKVDDIWIWNGFGWLNYDGRNDIAGDGKREKIWREGRYGNNHDEMESINCELSQSGAILKEGLLILIDYI